jgi:hypothetical protein
MITMRSLDIGRKQQPQFRSSRARFWSNLSYLVSRNYCPLPLYPANLFYEDLLQQDHPAIDRSMFHNCPVLPSINSRVFTPDNNDIPLLLEPDHGNTYRAYVYLLNRRREADLLAQIRRSLLNIGPTTDKFHTLR